MLTVRQFWKKYKNKKFMLACKQNHLYSSIASDIIEVVPG
jgi:hypothetical protein